MNQETLHWTVMSNGMQVKVKRAPYQRTINLGLFIAYGSQNETLETSGIAHYIEHVQFNPSSMPPELKQRVDTLMDYGASYEAFTSKEYTRFTITCLPEFLQQAVELLALLAKRNTVSIDAVEHERSIIMHEHSMTFSSSAIVKQVMENALWGDEGLGLYVIGRKQNIPHFTAEDLEIQLQQFYTPSRAFLVALGPVDIASFTQLAADNFGDWVGIQACHPEPTPNLQVASAALPIKAKRADFLLGYPLPGQSSSERHAFALLADILGTGFKSRLFQELREKRGLAYLVSAYAYMYGLAGYLAVHVNCEPEKIPEVYEATQREIENLMTERVTRDELERAQSARVTGVLSVLQNSPQHLQLLGMRAVLNQTYFVDQEVQGIRAVRHDDILRAANRAFGIDKPAVVGWGVQQAEMLSVV